MNNLELLGIPIFKKGSGIHIKKKNLIKKAQEGSVLNKTEWFDNWYLNRLHLLKNKVYGIPSYGLAYRFINMLEHTPEYYLPNPMYPNEANLPELPENSVYKYAQSKGAIGTFYPSSNGKPGTIVYMSPHESNLIHERTHALLAEPIEDLIKQYIDEKKGKILANGESLDKYLDDPKEIYARLMELRYNNKLDGSKKYKVKEVTPKGSYAPEVVIDLNESTKDFDILNRYTKEFTEFLLNDVAQNDTYTDTVSAKLGIKIKKENRGKFTDYCNGKVTQACIDKAKNSGNPTLIKRATFADNARTWKHANGGPVKTRAKRLDINGVRNDPEFRKLNNWYMNDVNLNILQDSLTARNADFPEQIAIFSLVIPESGGDTKPHGNGAFGQLGWRGPRAENLPEDAPGQTHKIMSEVYDNPRAKDWSHGGKGTGVLTGKEMMNLFLNTPNVEQAVKAFMKGYVRPESKEWERRLKLARILKRHWK